MINLPEKHVFVCVNCRESTRKSCGEEGLRIRTKLVELLKKTGRQKKIRINKSGCLNFCDKGPVMVIYPNKIWFKNVAVSDCEKIMNDSILDDKTIEQLLFENNKKHNNENS